MIEMRVYDGRGHYCNQCGQEAIVGIDTDAAHKTMRVYVCESCYRVYLEVKRLHLLPPTWMVGYGLYRKDEKGMTCPSCGGTGGSMGNPDPRDNWICSTCAGTGVVPDTSNGKEPEEKEGDEDDLPRV